MAGSRVGRRSARPTLGRRVTKCGKVRYRTELDAKMALANRVWKDKGEVRAYRHSKCGGWHLTSMPLGAVPCTS
jgi:hypothetical protein